MMKISKYYDAMSIATNYFTTREWSFKGDNVIDMMKEVKNLEDGDIIKLDLQDMDWDKYLATCVIGMKKFILKEDAKSVDAARQRLSIYVQKCLRIEN
jgi:hypothetical protein